MRSFAIIPAAGHSLRMGRPKLMLPWGETTIIEHLLNVWSASQVSEIVLVLRRDDQALAAVARHSRAHLVTPAIDPPEMKASILHGLDYVRATYHPTLADVWLLAPADLTGLTSLVIDRVLAEHCPSKPDILVPFVQSQRHHPVLFPWALAEEVKTLGENEGLNALVNRYTVRGIPCEESAILQDLDTPEDYKRLRPQ